MSKPAVEPLACGPLTLRLLEEGDLEMTRAWRNQDEIRQWFVSTEPVAGLPHRAWFDAYREKPDDFVFVIEETRDLRRAIGQVSLYHVDLAAGRAEFGRLMIGDREALGRGFGQAATRCLVDAAFERWHLREVYLEVKSSNHRAIAIYETCGFSTVSRAGELQLMATFRSNGGE